MWLLLLLIVCAVVKIVWHIFPTQRPSLASVQAPKFKNVMPHHFLPYIKPIQHPTPQPDNTIPPTEPDNHRKHSMSAALPAIHLYAWAFTWGGTGYYSYVASPIAFKTLPRKEFGTLQNKVFPNFFLLQALAPILIGATAPFALTTGALATLSVAVVGGAANKWWLLPVTRKIKEDRFALEDAGQTDSEEHKRLTSQFGKMHGLSLGFNLLNFLALTGYGYYLVKGLIRYVPK